MNNSTLPVKLYNLKLISKDQMYPNHSGCQRMRIHGILKAATFRKNQDSGKA